jgi:hypothetical protein
VHLAQKESYLDSFFMKWEMSLEATHD